MPILFIKVINLLKLLLPVGNYSIKLYCVDLNYKVENNASQIQY